MQDDSDYPRSRRGPPPPPPPVGYGPQVYRGYVVLILLGIVILAIGGIIAVSWGYMGDPDSDTIRVIQTTGVIIKSIGLIVLSLGLLLGAVNDNNLPINVRLGMLVAMGLIIAYHATTTVLPYYYY